MDNKLEKLLHEELEFEFDKITKMDAGSDSYTKTVDGITKLMDRAIEIDKLNIEYEKEVEARKFENDLKIKEFEEEKRDRLVKNCLTGAGIVLPLGATIWGVLKSLEFEKTGTITTIMGRGFFQKLLPKK